MENKVEEKSEMKPVDKNSKSLVFISEEDVFDVVVKYSEVEGRILVSSVDDNWVDSEDASKVVLTFKYPSQGDYDTISHSTKDNIMGNDFDIKQLRGLEFMRVLILIRKWSFDMPLTNENMLKLNTKIAKAIIIGVREKIGMEGII